MTERDPVSRLNQDLDSLMAIVQTILERLKAMRADLARDVRETVSDAISESIACVACDIDSPESLAAALKAGWIRLQLDATGLGWNYLGVCPGCQEQEREDDRRVVEGPSETPDTTHPPF